MRNLKQPTESKSVPSTDFDFSFEIGVSTPSLVTLPLDSFIPKRDIKRNVDLQMFFKRSFIVFHKIGISSYYISKYFI